MARRKRRRKPNITGFILLLLKGCIYWALIACAIWLVRGVLVYVATYSQQILIVLAVPFLLFVGVSVYAAVFFNGKRFTSIKSSIGAYIQDCNDLNAHIEVLRSSYVNFRKTDYGETQYSNIGRQNFKRKGIASAKYAPNIFDCSKAVCDNARRQPFKYICKYFNIPETESSLEEFEEILNNFSAAEDGKQLSPRKRQEILHSIEKDIPPLIRKLFSKRLSKELGFEEFRFDELYYPVFSFRYISSGGNSGAQFDTTMDIPMLERFVEYLSRRITFKKSVEGQRRLMTPALRRYIIDRDGNTCRLCGNSTRVEPNLLLEVDHIIPVSKGGLTTEENLQTLCWKCNRSKGAKIIA